VEVVEIKTREIIEENFHRHLKSEENVYCMWNKKKIK
jgi:hypothetical protein